ncbi:fibrobacter succinogenes major paralogous domain-containing protein [Algoriphagus hitonicola]|uniref:Major paralogous domain-containing protein n=1 Tax=Algoriphagus hitonicola TaxID=435880 RepID=A0A1I2W183_9BACT|nr:FISUMP domain-containing protein [Algoriphagus hitonicola]SFG95042.1 major paralogous domain-containing protein [Algoriphagus hitonicola]
MKNFQWSKLKACTVLFVIAGVMCSCSLDTLTDDLSKVDFQTEKILESTDIQTANMRIASTASCENDCIEPGSSTFYPVSDMATASSGINTKSVSYSAYNTETDFVVEVTYAITSGPTDANAIIIIDIEGDEMEYTEVSSGSTVSHTVPLAGGWAGCDQVAFSVVQEELGTPIAFSESYSLIPVCLDEDVINPSTGKTWMDRNLGASQVATSSKDLASYGDLYQWGRGTDGHQLRTSGTTATLSSSDNPGHGDFITSSTLPFDWRSPQNNDLWQGVNGINNPCPSGYRLPTDAELDSERTTWSANTSEGAFASPLKLPAAGFRSGTGGLLNVGLTGLYWTSTVSSTSARALIFGPESASMTGRFRVNGQSVRCLKD